MIKLKTLLEMKDWSQLTSKDMELTNRKTRSVLQQLMDIVEEALPRFIQAGWTDERAAVTNIVNGAIRDLIAHSWAIPDENIQKMVTQVVDEWFMRKYIRAKTQAP